jgi:fido (protein-threonine AMPylation protein)
VNVLRNAGTLTEDTLRHYYGEKRFEQVAESNALEGSSLGIGETRLAVLKGTTLTGHDPAYVRDAIALDHALTRLCELAQSRDTPTDITQLTELHSLLLGERPGAGEFRRDRVIISGARHVPPKTWQQVMTAMEAWEQWSLNNPNAPAPLRSIVLHAWLTHTHPFGDGNGRCARAIGNLELIRAGYPPIIIKRTDRDRYLESLAESDEGGDIRSFTDLVFDRLEGALRGLENSATQRQGYDPVAAKVRVQQESHLQIWETGVRLLAAIINDQVSERLERVGGRCGLRHFSSPLDVDAYIDVCNGRSVPRSWAFFVSIDIPGIPKFERLAYIGHRSPQMFQSLGREGGPALYWSKKNPSGFPKWTSAGQESPYAVEITNAKGNGDQWFVRRVSEAVESVSTTLLGHNIADALVKIAIGDTP